MKSKGKKEKKDDETKYPHNPSYCMILPDADHRDDEDISSTGQS